MIVQTSLSPATWAVATPPRGIPRSAGVLKLRAPRLHGTARDSAAATLQGQRDAQIKEMTSSFASKKDGVENMLAGFVTKVNTEPPKARSQLA